MICIALFLSILFFLEFLIYKFFVLIIFFLETIYIQNMTFGLNESDIHVEFVNIIFLRNKMF